MNRRLTRIVGISLLLLPPQLVAAQEITFNFTGTVTHISNFSPASISLGQQVSGSFTFDTTATDQDPSPVYGVYAAVTRMDVEAPFYSATATVGASRGTIRLLNDEDGLRDEYIVSMGIPGQNLTGTIVPGYTLDRLAIVLRDRTTFAFASDALPLAPPSLADFAFGKEFFIDFNGPNGSAFVAITLDTLTGVTISGLLNDLVQAVIALNANGGISNSLDAKLGLVMSAIDDVNGRNDVAAQNAMQAFINAVAAQRGKNLTEGQADLLIEVAHAVIAALSN